MMNAKQLTAVMLLCIGPNGIRAAQALPTENLVVTGSPALQDTLPDLSQKIWKLSDCIEYASRENITLKKSRITAETATVDIKEAKASLFPSLSFSTGHNLVNRPYQESSSTVSGTEILRSNGRTSYNGNYGLNAQWTLYNGSRRLNTLKQEKINSQIAELDVHTTANSIEEQITQLYIQILYATESIQVNKNTLEVSVAQCERGKELLAAGSISKADYAQLESQVSNDKYQLVTAETTLADYKLQLKQLLELEGEQEMQLYIPQLDQEDVLLPLPSKSEVYRTALTFRPEIEAGRLNIESSELDIDIARAGYMPSINLSAGIGTTGSSGSDFTFSEQLKNGWNNSIGITLSVPIFNNRQTKSAVERAKLQLQTSRLELMEREKELYKSIESLWQDARSAQQQYAAASEKLKSSQTSFDLVNEQFNMGMKNTVEMLTEKNNLLNAQQESLQAKYMAILDLQLLRFYQGEEMTFE